MSEGLKLLVPLLVESQFVFDAELSLGCDCDFVDDAVDVAGLSAMSSSLTADHLIKGHRECLRSEPIMSLSLQLCSACCLT